MKLSVTVPDGYTGEVMSDLNGKRGRILGMNPANNVTLIEAEVPQSEVLRYAQDLRSLTQGAVPIRWSSVVTSRCRRTWNPGS